VWSVSVPIALVEILTPDRQTTPWLGRIGLAVTAVLFVIGAASTTAINMALWPYVASVPQLAVTVLAIVALVVAAFVVGRRERPAPGAVPSEGAARTAGGPDTAPNPWVVGGAALVAGAIFVELTSLPQSLPAWVVVLGFLLLFAVVIVLVRTWSARPGWGDQQRLALAGGALLTYAWHAFPQGPVVPVSPAVDLIGNTVFALGAVALLGVAARRVDLRLPQLPTLTAHTRQESRT
jgi:hypothetical protein